MLWVVAIFFVCCVINWWRLYFADAPTMQHWTEPVLGSAGAAGLVHLARRASRKSK